jgi:hypothetical protein
VRRDADDGVGADDAAHVVHRQIVLPDMDAVGAGESREIGAVVDDQPRAGRAGHRDGGVGQPQARTAREALVAQLDERRAPLEQRRQHRQRIEPARAAEIDVNQRVDGREAQHGSSP